ncbi:exoenzyme S synthesis protein B [Carboxylicivirga sediminis]|uniref:Exoenzyme S synthesis protein B n=1 Tax=Carboxylicivirga sediminis TaxID=2006564 RepID=A0A941F2H7_9BACT|nr:exoenzyme S synthesis protein B [Carboxylicivirga sediminis]MBR8535541.1 exoenzyme S synthesis protein B [Carboxylicivirga sediminis]
MEKQEALINWFKKNTEGYLLFSGGFDSSAVLGAAMKANANIQPIWVNNGFNRAQAGDMIIQARNLGAADLKIIEVTPGETVIANPERRCYHCKSHILSLVPKDGRTIYDGTTASDLGNYRPGKKALDEYHVKSPLAELGISSWETKEIALAFGADPLFAEHESCLATRINYNELLTSERIKAIYEVENYIIDKTGDFHVRCRIDDSDHMRIELTKPESYALITDEKVREELFEIGGKVCLFVTIDVKRSRPNEYDKRIKK